LQTGSIKRSAIEVIDSQMSALLDFASLTTFPPNMICHNQPIAFQHLQTRSALHSGIDQYSRRSSSASAFGIYQTQLRLRHCYRLILQLLVVVVVVKVRCLLRYRG